MFRIKRLYTFMLQTFLPVLCMTFFICLFIILMQFLWKYVDEMAGKGLELKVLFEFFFYAALSFTPMALPLAVLLASLMTFGNLSERLELLAMKAAGVSLIRIMRPLIIVICLIAVGAFFFQNEVLPRAQVKLYSLLFSIRHKSPELDIPEGAFYKEIDGFNLYIQSKDHKTGMLYDVMIYDFSRSFEDAAVIVADSGKLKMADDKTHLYLTLWSGESFENLKDQRTVSSNVPYRRESFSLKEIVIEFDANFSRMDESFMANQFIGKNMNQLRSSIDSLSMRKDSVAGTYAHTLTKTAYFRGSMNDSQTDTIFAAGTVLAVQADSIIEQAGLRQKKNIYDKALSKTTYIKQDFDFKQTLQNDERKNIRRHEIEMHKKFTLSIACLIFFFIGAPLGAIIGKGGLGMPVIISIVLFIIYYIIDNSGVKMARDGKLGVWEGMWLSSAVLFPLGVFFTYKAINDSVLFNWDVIHESILNFLGLRKQRKFVKKEVIIEPVNKTQYADALLKLNAQIDQYMAVSDSSESTQFFNFFRRMHQPQGLDSIYTNYNLLLEQGSNAEEQAILNLLSQQPILYKMTFASPVSHKLSGLLLACLLPFSIPYYFFSLLKRKIRHRSLRQIVTNNKQLISLLEK